MVFIEVEPCGIPSCSAFEVWLYFSCEISRHRQSEINR
jgi:hypothetical protein